MIFPRREEASNKDLILTIIEIQSYLQRYGKSHTNWHETLNEVVARLEQEPKTEWIPVSERLPEDRRAVLVTAYWHETYQVMMASYYGDGLWWCVPFNNCGEHMQRLKPKAWMPLPTPYEPQESEE